MEERKLKRKIEINAKKFMINPKDRTLLLKGKELEESLKYLSENNRKFMLSREIELIEESIKYRDRKKFLIDTLLFTTLVVIIGTLFIKKEIIFNTFNRNEKIFKKEERIELKEPQKEIKVVEEKINNSDINDRDGRIEEKRKVIKEENKSIEENISTENIYNISIDKNGSN